MEYNAEKKEIILNRELNKLDKFVIDFCSLLDEYVIVSGYVSILMGRTRATEDVDLLVPSMDENEFIILWEKINKNGFECINTHDLNEAFDMLKEHAIRFFYKVGKPVPNIEFKFIKTDLDRYSFENRVKVIINENKLFISPIEMQIAFKLFLASDGEDEEISSDKDIEDAKHLYNVFKDKINKEELSTFIDRLGVKNKMKWLEK